MMRRHLFVVAILLLGGISKAQAQFNDSIHNYIQYGLTGIFNKTDDSRSFLISNDLQYKLHKKNKSINFAGSYVYGEQLNVQSNNDISASLDFNLFPKDSSKLYYWGLLNYDKSFSLNINGRLQAGLGAAYNFYSDAKRFLNISDGFLYETSDVQLTGNTSEKFSIIRNSFRLRYRFAIGKFIVMDGANLLQNSLSDKNDYIIKLSNNINVKLNTWLSFRAATTYNRNNLSGRQNLLITVGLTTEKFF